MFTLEFPWALLLLPAPFLVWWLLPAYREPRSSLRIPFFDEVAQRSGVKPAVGGAQLGKNWLQRLLGP